MRPFIREVGHANRVFENIFEADISWMEETDLGVSPIETRRRTNGFRGIDGIERCVGREIARPDYPLSEYANEKTIFLEAGSVSFLG
jgi:hypothetical protein